MPSERDKMLAGSLYDPRDPEIVTAYARAQRRLRRFNATAADDADEQRRFLVDLLGAVGPGSVVTPVFACDLGYNIRLGTAVFVNAGFVFLDCALIVVGDHTLIGPGVQLLTPDHPRDAALRRSGLESAHAIVVGRDVWIGGGALVLPGVTIGDEAIVGAGCVVTRDVEPGMCVVGNPARPVRRSAT